MNNTSTEDPADLPPGPWPWASTDPHEDLACGGAALVAAEGALVLCSEDGYATTQGSRKARSWPYLVEELERLNAALEDARFWARHYASGAVVRDLEPPTWLTDTEDPDDL